MEKILAKRSVEYWELMVKVHDELPNPEAYTIEERLQFATLKKYDNEIVKLKELANAKAPRSKRAQIAWITITKLTDMPDQEFIDKCNNLKNYKPYNSRLKYCFEATEIKDGKFHNVHCHLLFDKQKGYNDSKYIRYTKLKVPCFNVYTSYYKADYYNDKVDYLLGIKTEDQGEKDNVTFLFRKKYNLI